MKKCYHMTSLDRVRSISVSGLTPKNGDNSKTVNDEKVKVFFSEGMTGAVALYADLQKHYDDIKAGKEKLMTGANALFTKMYEQAAAQQQEL